MPEKQQRKQATTAFYHTLMEGRKRRYPFQAQWLPQHV
jgi:hypothetical protein